MRSALLKIGGGMHVGRRSDSQRVNKAPALLRGYEWGRLRRRGAWSLLYTGLRTLFCSSPIVIVGLGKRGGKNERCNKDEARPRERRAHQRGHDIHGLAHDRAPQKELFSPGSIAASLSKCP
jgi:hypothetical protein